MFIWVPWFLASLVLAWAHEKHSTWEYDADGQKVLIKQENVYFYLLVICMSLFVGLRLWCNDTGTYLNGYASTSQTGPLISDLNWGIGHDAMFTLFNRILRRLGVSSQNFLMFFSFLTNGLCLWFLRKYSTNFTLSVFLFWTMGVYLFSAAAMRQAAAIAVALIGVDQGLRKKWVPFVVWIVIASMFHPYAVMFLILPFVRFPPWEKKTWYMLGMAAVGGFGLQRMVGTILDITSMMGKNYDANTFSGEGVNIFRLLVVWAPVVLSFLAREQMQKSQDETNNLFMNFSMINAEIMFIALFGTANYFARLANYFLIYQTLALPWMFRFFNRKSQWLLTLGVILCYTLYFIFANVILTPFNTYFAKMSLWKYLQTLFSGFFSSNTIIIS